MAPILRAGAKGWCGGFAPARNRACYETEMVTQT